MGQNRPQGTTVFVGNISYDTTEEELRDVFSQVGTVVSFRLLYDASTGRAKGYGFCEYEDKETAMSARRNLNGTVVHNRPLRVDQTDSDKPFANANGMNASGNNNPGGGGGAAPSGASPAGTSAHDGAGAGGSGSASNPGAGGGTSQTQVGGSAAMLNSAAGPTLPPALASANPSLAFLTLPEIHQTMVYLKRAVVAHPNEMRELLTANPRLAHAVLQGQIMLGMVPPPLMCPPPAPPAAAAAAAAPGSGAAPSTNVTGPPGPPVGTAAIPLPVPPMPLPPPGVPPQPGVPAGPPGQPPAGLPPAGVTAAQAQRVAAGLQGMAHPPLPNAAHPGLVPPTHGSGLPPPQVAVPRNMRRPPPPPGVGLPRGAQPPQAPPPAPPHTGQPPLQPPGPQQQQGAGGQPAQGAGEGYDEQTAILSRVINLTPQEIEELQPEHRQYVLQLKELISMQNSGVAIPPLPNQAMVPPVGPRPPQPPPPPQQQYR